MSGMTTALLSVAVLCLGATACSTSAADQAGTMTPSTAARQNAADGKQVQAAAPEPSTNPGPYSAKQLYVPSDSNAAVAVADSEPQAAERLGVLAATPTAVWFAGGDNPYERVDEVMTNAEAEGAMPTLVVYNIPGRDCGLYSSGGSEGIDEYLNWVGSFAAGLQGREAIIIVEPDAVAHSITGCSTAESSLRHQMLALAVEIIQRQPNSHVYIDAGNASWVDDLPALAAALEESGIEMADGFALNVSNFERTDVSVVYGQDLSRLVGDKPFVIDVSRNGAGPPTGEGSHPDGDWCNPMAARIGSQPSLNTRLDRVDALLWIKLPGDSDGECSPGAPAAGVWWPDFAEALVAEVPSTQSTLVEVD